MFLFFKLVGRFKILDLGKNVKTPIFMLRFFTEKVIDLFINRMIALRLLLFLGADATVAFPPKDLFQSHLAGGLPNDIVTKQSGVESTVHFLAT